MKTFLGGVAAVVLVCGTASAQPSRLTDDTLRSIALRVNELEMRRQLTSATPATIDSLLTLYADGIVYEHPNAGAVVRGKDVMRRNMIEYLGSVRAVRAEPAHVTAGHGVVVIETNAHMEINDGGKWVPVARHGLRVIEFDAHGLVRRIIDYPW